MNELGFPDKCMRAHSNYMRTHTTSIRINMHEVCARIHTQNHNPKNIEQKNTKNKKSSNLTYFIHKYEVNLN